MSNYNDIEFYNIRSTSKGREDSFEELSCQLFYRNYKNKYLTYHRLRGAGGDGGVEAYFISKDKTKIAIQSKFWDNHTFTSTQISQLTTSIDTAMKNHPCIEKYYISIPFNFTGKVAEGKKGKSQTEKFEDWKKSKEKEHNVKIILWGASKLLDLITVIDTNGGMLRYWFDRDILTNVKYEQLLELSIVQAGKRYTPELSVKVPLLEALDAFTTPKTTFEKLKKYINSYSELLKTSYTYIDKKIQKFECADELKSIESLLFELFETESSYEQQINSVLSKLNNLVDSLNKAEKDSLNDLKNKYGDNFADTPSFRQFHAEYMATFPAAELDSIRELIENINEITSWIYSIEVRLCFSRKMLIHGVAGIGKTHSILDYISKDECTSNWVFFGEDFSDKDAWKQIASKLGIPSVVSGEQLFEIISQHAYSMGTKGVIFIDALNETNNHKMWKTWLPVLVFQILKYDNLKICVSCRNGFLNEVFGDDEKSWQKFSHNGFLGKEYLAIQEFFSYYKLKPPVIPLMQNEFKNPLFLHLVCQSINNEGFSELPRGKWGFNYILNSFLEYKNKIIADKCDFDPNKQIVYQVLDDFSKIIFETKSRKIPYDDAEKITLKYHSSLGFESSLINQLDKEGLITFINIKTEKIEYPQRYCRFTFERVGDYLIARSILQNNLDYDEYFSKNIDFLDPGILEALSVLIPENIPDFEILNYINTSDVRIAFLCSLEWRTSESISALTKNWVYRILSSDSEVSNIVFESLISISFIPDNLLNANLLDELLSSKEMCELDSFWSYFLIEGYAKKNSVWTLIDWACFSELDNFNKDSLYLWAICLAWFTSCSDRRIRDRSSKGLTRILLADLRNCVGLLNCFHLTGDDYILERVTLAIYSALLLEKHFEIAELVSIEIIENEMILQSDNIIIKDTLRLIVEFAYSHNQKFISNFNIQEFRNSKNKNVFYKDDDNAYLELLEIDAFNSSNINFVDKWYTDFQRYVLGTRLRIFDLEGSNIELNDIYKWLINELHKLGYPGHDSKCWSFDSYIMFKNGNGRGKPVWAERLSKKYYWILLHRLIGLLNNSVTLKKSEYSDITEPKEVPILSLPVRKIDLTDLRFSMKNQYTRIKHNELFIEDSISPKEWILDKKYFYDFSTLIQKTHDEYDERWIPLLYYDSIDTSEAYTVYPYKEKASQISALIIEKKDLLKIESSSKLIRYSNVFDYIQDDYEIFLGEYPNSRCCDEKTETGEWRSYFNLIDNVKGTPTIINFLRGAEWEYDCSFDSKSIYMPSKCIINDLKLRWDFDNSWYDENGKTTIISTETNRGSAVWIYKSKLDKYLNENKVLIYITYNEKMYVQNSGSTAKGLHSIRDVYTFDGQKLNILCSVVGQDDFMD